MWIVRLALRRPYTFVVASMLIAIAGAVSIRRMETDIFPEINIPVVAVIWTYEGIPPDQMEQRIVGSYERVLFSTVSDIEHVESQSLNGISVVKVFLQEGASVDAAISQIVATSQQALKSMPPGIFPPLVMRYNAANVPIVQASIGSESLTEQQLYDLATNSMRPGLAPVRGAQLTWPYGGKVRQIMIDIDPAKLHAWGISPGEVSEAVNAQNLILPSGSVKIGAQEMNVRLNGSPEAVEAIGDLPIKSVGSRTIFIRDIAAVRDGFAPQTNIVHVDGKRGVLQPILKSSGSTLDIVQGVRDRLPAVMATLPEEMNVTLLADQSIFVRHAVQGVLVEAGIAAGLTGAMILLFLGSWRSTLIIVISIPLAILASITIMGAIGHSLNVMTLGGLALAVGILVDDATVEIENIHRNLHMRKGLTTAILDGAQQIAMPAFVSTLCICIVFLPIGFITGAARALFVPMALAVVFAMFASYLLSRTLVPTMTRYLLAAEVERYSPDGHTATPGVFGQIHNGFNRLFDRLKGLYGSCLSWMLAHRAATLTLFALFAGGSFALAPMIGQDFFPSVDSGQIRLHVRAPAGTRVEETERHFARVVDTIHEIIPAHEIESIIDNIGIPNSGINLALSDGTLMSSADGEILVTLHHGHSPTAEHQKQLRRELQKRFPELTFFYKPPDIVTQVLNFGLSAPIDIQLTGPRRNQKENFEIAQQIRSRIEAIPGASDVRIHQVPFAPELRIETDRTLLSQLGISQYDVASDVLVSLSSSKQTNPNYWLDPKKGIQYPLVVQSPQRQLDSVSAITGTPITPRNANADSQLLGNLGYVKQDVGATNVTHYNVAGSIDILAGVDGADLGSVSAQINRVLDEFQDKLPRGTTIKVRGQVESMRSSFAALGYGVIFAIVLVYLLMVVNFQSWTDPFIVLMALPGAVSGILWMLFVTQTTINVPSLMGTIMCIGVATANSILLVTFANDQRQLGKNAHDAAWAAGVTRLRPVLMTAGAMILGMLPMSLGFGEGGEQNAPLGRAVIGGLMMATLATLILVPVIYSLLRVTPPKSQQEMDNLEEPAAV
ncbi:efflux RND transporter permease subunit [Blastopirellula sp. JC732]|uniref:Efflux RND transporter permease subunit n=1 Tax=Blastopirellula sediminis TaxID=2894196 RepID=A0A9X1SMS5_9BACT|nr:efflux RND transporter permease subunit [Blastopirellula sediminis]MCC9604707.1 efflux RND transporter permease subunit [Blastopirellula sediminis]MCC9631994.1 efflux RND transporter permease subunit [Blastopirellula sediminis]